MATWPSQTINLLVQEGKSARGEGIRPALRLRGWEGKENVTLVRYLFNISKFITYLNKIACECTTSRMTTTTTLTLSAGEDG